MSQTTFSSYFAVYQTCRNIEAQVKLYTQYGFVVDKGFAAIGGMFAPKGMREAYEEIPDEYYEARGVSAQDVVKTEALKLPADPYMHLILTEFKTPQTGPKWPATYDQLGSRGHSFLVKSVDAELRRISKEFPKIKILHGQLSINRQWGKTTSALVLDPEGVFLELVEVDSRGSFFSTEPKVPPPTEKSWLHYQLNSEDTREMLPFYQSFGLSHDHGVDFRQDIGFYPEGKEKFASAHLSSMGMVLGNSISAEFLRNLSDPSNMHLELLLYKPGTLKDPDSHPIWPQKGISRYCFRTATKEQDLQRARNHGHKIFIPHNTICVQWGDSEYFYFSDADGNILTSEQWHHQRYFGAKT